MSFSKAVRLPVPRAEYYNPCIPFWLCWRTSVLWAHRVGVVGLPVMLFLHTALAVHTVRQFFGPDCAASQCCVAA
jgi:hypothetical protein